MKANDLPIVFCTCDGYCDLWNDFFRLFKKYWPDYKGSIILDTESNAAEFPGLNISSPLNCDLKTSWSERLYLSLCKIDSPYCLIFLDDFYLRGPVNTDVLNRALCYMNAHENIAGITFLKEPGEYKEIDLGTAKFALRKKLSPYTTTAHITLYRTDFLRKIVRKYESAWEFETNGTIRSWFSRYRFMSALNNDAPVFPYDGGALVRGGCFDRELKAYFNDIENCCLGNSRPCETVAETAGNQFTLFKTFKYGIRGLASLFSERCDRE